MYCCLLTVVRWGCGLQYWDKRKILTWNKVIYSYKTTSCGNTNMGQTPLLQSIQVQNPRMSPFFNVDLVWKNRFKYGGHNKVAIEITYIIPCKDIKIFGACTRGHVNPNWMKQKQKLGPIKKSQKNNKKE